MMSRCVMVRPANSSTAPPSGGIESRPESHSVAAISPKLKRVAAASFGMKMLSTTTGPWITGRSTETAAPITTSAALVFKVMRYGFAQRNKRMNRRMFQRLVRQFSIEGRVVAPGRDFTHQSSLPVGASDRDSVRPRFELPKQLTLACAVAILVALYRFEVGVIASLRQQFLMCAGLQHASIVDDVDAIGVPCRGHTVRNQQGRLARAHSSQTSQYLFFGFRVDAGEAVVQQQHVGALYQASRQRRPLFLTARKRGPALADDGVEPIRQASYRLLSSPPRAARRISRLPRDRACRK